jgi:hypothetical protein
MQFSDRSRKEMRLWLAVFISALITGLSCLPYYEIFAKDGSIIERLQEAIAVLFLPGLFVSMVLSGNIHGGSRELGAVVNFLGYGFASYLLLSWRHRISRSRNSND